MELVAEEKGYETVGAIAEDGEVEKDDEEFHGGRRV